MFPRKQHKSMYKLGTQDQVGGRGAHGQVEGTGPPPKLNGKLYAPGITPIRLACTLIEAGFLDKKRDHFCFM